MSTFHNFSQCIYTTQGKVVCDVAKNGKQNKLPMTLETFINEVPNQRETDCVTLSKKLNDVISNYPSCNTASQRDKGECIFTFKCSDST